MTITIPTIFLWLLGIFVGLPIVVGLISLIWMGILFNKFFNRF